MGKNPTHFICVPAKLAIKDGLNNFKNSVLNDPDVTIEEALFQVPEKLHVTVCLMSLNSEEERQRAVQCLNEVKETVWRPIFEHSGPIKARFSGLGTFQKNHRRAYVVYGNVLSDNFAMFANGICEEYVEKQLVERQSLSSRYHLTVLNSQFLEKSIRRITPNFDATRLLRKYRGYNFGEMIVDELHLSTIGSRDENGCYEVIGKVNL